MACASSAKAPRTLAASPHRVIGAERSGVRRSTLGLTVGSELIPVTAGRPPLLVKDGCRVYISVHDEFYRRRKAEFRQRLKLSHPDMTPVHRFHIASSTRRSHVSRSRAGDSYMRKEHAHKAYVLTVKNRGQQFRHIMDSYEKWLHGEKVWYAQYGLSPPE
jgi:hypothetical protein